MVNTKETTVELQSVQQQNVASVSPIEYGRTTRPLNARTATTNRYLDSCTIVVNNINYTDTVNIQDTNLSIVGKLKRATKEYVSGKRALYIPADGTYMINGYISNDVDTGYGREMQKNDTTFIWNRDGPAPGNTRILQGVSTVMDFKKGEFFNVKTWSHGTDTVDIKIIITKIS